MIVGLVVLLLLCPCLGLAGWAVLWAAGDDGNRPSVSAPVPGVPDTSGEPADPSPAPSSTASGPGGGYGLDLAAGDCVVNDGTEDDAELREVPCGPNTFEVLLRLPATTEGERCASRAPEATANYVHDNPVDLLDYVLCLKRR
ncbi:LppU/SCO3897 family protein [Micromonospora endolithica]|uniref:Uncharacterized protein n=1 Tax=Micromonospora endolithica TaxID=230091 RepID=A0A3A9ZDJ4_9ACTN|nr:hypothetical protein D7223_15325 [Micromonospora endolithica]